MGGPLSRFVIGLMSCAHPPPLSRAGCSLGVGTTYSCASLASFSPECSQPFLAFYDINIFGAVESPWHLKNRMSFIFGFLMSPLSSDSAFALSAHCFRWACSPQEIGPALRWCPCAADGDADFGHLHRLLSGSPPFDDGFVLLPCS